MKACATAALAALLAGCEAVPTAEGGPDVAAEGVAAPAVAASGAASAPAAPAALPAHFQSGGFSVHWRQPAPRGPGDDVQVEHEGRDVRVVVTSVDGRGQMELWPLRGVWPHAVQVQFQHAAGQPFDTLEGVRLQVLNPAHQAGNEEPPPVPDGFIVWQREGRMAVSLPGGWPAQRQGLRVTWVNRYGQ